jgi:capsular polysaccharide biosynthesis protein
VIAPHGAGMANAYFVNPSATVVELVRKGQQGRVRQLELKPTRCAIR